LCFKQDGRIKKLKALLAVKFYRFQKTFLFVGQRKKFYPESGKMQEKSGKFAPFKAVI
jgi:hypothetical protein